MNDVSLKANTVATVSLIGHHFIRQWCNQQSRMQVNEDTNCYTQTSEIVWVDSRDKKKKKKNIYQVFISTVMLIINSIQTINWSFQGGIPSQG